MDPSRCNECGHLRFPLPTPPPYNHLLRHEKVLSNIDIASINEQITRQLSTIDKIDQEILKLQEARTAARNFISEMRSIFSPIHRMPVEILSGIMESVVLSKVKLGDDMMPEDGDRPPVFHRVCKWWRDVAISTLMLWRYVASTQRTSADHISRVLQWSGQVLLTIAVEGEADQPSFALAIEAAHRWKSVTLTRVSEEMRLNLNSAAGRFQNLESLCLQGADSYLPNGFQFQLAKQLRKLIIHGSFSSNTLSAPWMQLIVVNFWWMDINDCFQILQLCRSLTKCRLGWLEGTLFSTPSKSSVPLRKLKFLHIDIDDATHLSDLYYLFLSLQLPALHRLVLEDFDENSASFIPGILNHANFVSTLDLQQCTITTPVLVEVLKALPSLSQLVLTYCQSVDLGALIATLTLSSTNEGDILVPSLSSINIEAMVNLHERLARAVEARIRSRWYSPLAGDSELSWAQSTSLSSVILRTVTASPFDGVHLLKGLFHAGFDIHIFHGAYCRIHDLDCDDGREVFE